MGLIATYVEIRRASEGFITLFDERLQKFACLGI
jgi:hypothetical protein